MHGGGERLIRLLARHATIPTTYAGGVASMADLELIRDAGQGRLDVTVGSALDIFGGTGITYREVVRSTAWRAERVAGHERAGSQKERSSDDLTELKLFVEAICTGPFSAASGS